MKPNEIELYNPEGIRVDAVPLIFDSRPVTSRTRRVTYALPSTKRWDFLEQCRAQDDKLMELQRAGKLTLSDIEKTLDPWVIGLKSADRKFHSRCRCSDRSESRSWRKSPRRPICLKSRARFSGKIGGLICPESPIE
jgi:hypothetical protein